MAPERRPLRLYTRPSEHADLDWSWVEGQLLAAPTYWVVADGDPFPHPRPVWGIWRDEHLFLSVGSPGIRRVAQPGAPLTVHLDSGTDVVIVEGRVAGSSAAPDVIDGYDDKYDYRYDHQQYGPLLEVAPVTVLAWRTAGWAGRDSFQQTGRWTFPDAG